MTTQRLAGIAPLGAGDVPRVAVNEIFVRPTDQEASPPTTKG